MDPLDFQAPTPVAPSPTPEPPHGTVERWAWDLIHARTLAEKLAPPAPPGAWEPVPPARRPLAPGRPPELCVVAKSPRTPRPGAFRRPEVRAALLHTFLHHELQAAELFAWALLAFPDSPRAFRAGLRELAREELAHAGLYRAQLERLGARVGDFAVRDWFWARVPTCSNAAQFCAMVGIGLEGANLDHAPDFARRFREAGDEEGADLQERVARDELSHVRFAARWFERWTGGGFEAWVAALPAPLSPILFRGPRIAREARLAAGLDEDFVHALERWPDPAPG